MANLIDRRCSCCGNIYKHEEYQSYISFCPNCLKDGFFEPYYTENGIMPCRIFLGEETIGELTSVSESSYIITSDRFDIHERIDDSDNPYLEAADMLLYVIKEPNKVMRLKERIKRKFILENPHFRNDDYLDIVTVQAIVEVMKRIFDAEMKKTERSMEKAFFEGVTDKNKPSDYDKNKEKWKRTLKNIEKFRYGEGKKIEDLSGEFPQELRQLKKKIDSSKSNLVSNHYNISKQNVKEIYAFHELKICKSILNKRIESVKKVSNYNFEAMFNEYDSYFINEIDKLTDDEYLSVVFDLFNFEDKFSLELVYKLADYFIKHNVDDVVFDRAKWLYVSPVRTPNGAFCMNRAFFLREMFIPILLECDDDEFNERKIAYTLYIELVFAFKKHMIDDSVLEEIPRQEWVDFIKENYNLLGTFKRDKEWEPEKIRRARKIFEKWSGQGII